jgi:hypothetical protein
MMLVASEWMSTQSKSASAKGAALNSAARATDVRMGLITAASSSRSASSRCASLLSAACTLSVIIVRSCDAPSPLSVLSISWPDLWDGPSPHANCVRGR